MSVTFFSQFLTDSNNKGEMVLHFRNQTREKTGFQSQFES